MPIQNLRLFTLLQKIKMLFNRLFPRKTLNIFFIISLLSLNYLKTSCFVFPKYAHSNISCINDAPILLILSRSLHSGQEK